MVKFDFNEMLNRVDKISNEIDVIIDGKKYPNETINFDSIKEIKFMNSNGNVILKGFFKIEKLYQTELNNLIKIEQLNVKFSQTLKNFLQFHFAETKIIINFELNDNNKNLIFQNFHKIPQKFHPKIENNFLEIIQINSFENLNILNLINDENEIEDFKENFSESENSQIITNNNINFEFPNQISKYFKKEDGSKKNIPIDDSNDYEMDSEKNDSIKDEKVEFNLNENFISFENLDKFNFNKEIHNLVENPEKYIEKKEKKFCDLSCMNLFGDYFKVNENHFYLSEMCLNNLNLNSDINSDKNYINVTLFNYLEIFDNFLKEKFPNEKVIFNKINDLNLTDFSNLISNYISHLENYIISLNNNEQIDSNIKNNLIFRIKKEILTLKLFSLLFLNCFISVGKFNENKFSEENFKDVKNMKMRKKKLIEWLIEAQKDEFNNKIQNFNDFNSKIIYSLINGQILYSIKECQKQNKPILALLISQLNNQISQEKCNIYLNSNYKKLNISNNLKKIYNLIGSNCKIENENNYNLIIENYCNWKNILIQITLFLTEPDKNINELIELLEIEINKNNNKIISFYIDNDKYEINYLLLKMYYYYIKNENFDNQIKLLNNLTHSLSFHDSNCDHHVQYIIINILSRIIQKLNINDEKYLNYIKKTAYFLTKKINEEIFIIFNKEKIDDNLYNKLLNFSDISNEMKSRLKNRK